MSKSSWSWTGQNKLPYKNHAHLWEYVSSFIKKGENKLRYDILGRTTFGFTKVTKKYGDFFVLKRWSVSVSHKQCMYAICLNVLKLNKEPLLKIKIKIAEILIYLPLGWGWYSQYLSLIFSLSGIPVYLCCFLQSNFNPLHDDDDDDDDGRNPKQPPWNVKRNVNNVLNYQPQHVIAGFRTNHQGPKPRFQNISGTWRKPPGCSRGSFKSKFTTVLSAFP